MKSVFELQAFINYSFSKHSSSTGHFDAFAHYYTASLTANSWHISYCGQATSSRKNASSVNVVVGFDFVAEESNEISIDSYTNSFDLDSGIWEVSLDFMCSDSSVLFARIYEFYLFLVCCLFLVDIGEAWYAWLATFASLGLRHTLDWIFSLSFRLKIQYYFSFVDQLHYLLDSYFLSHILSNFDNSWPSSTQLIAVSHEFISRGPIFEPRDPAHTLIIHWSLDYFHLIDLVAEFATNSSIVLIKSTAVTVSLYFATPINWPKHSFGASPW